jgi:hypothetical protein
MQIQENTVETDQAMGDDGDQKEDLNHYDDRVLKIPDHIIVRHQPGGHAAHIVIDCEVQSQNEQEQRTRDDLGQPEPGVFTRARA